MKKSTKIVIVSLIAAIVIAAAAIVTVLLLRKSPTPAQTSTETVNEYDNETVQFGSYPQSKVTDEKLIQELNKLDLNWISYNYLESYENVGDTVKPVRGNSIRYADIVYQNERYRAVVMDQYRSNYSAGDESEEEAHSGYRCDTVYWFRYEPLRWKAIADDGFYLCENLIDAQPFNEELYFADIPNNGDATYRGFGDMKQSYYASNYAKSSIRQWLNTTFLQTAFTKEEQSMIQSTPTITDGYFSSIGESGFEALDSEATDERLSLLAFQDVINDGYGFSTDMEANDDRMAVGTDYAIVQGLIVMDDENHGSWILRSAGDNSEMVCAVNQYGAVETVARTDVCTYGIRPAFISHEDLSMVESTAGVENGNEANLMTEATVAEQTIETHNVVQTTAENNTTKPSTTQATKAPSTTKPTTTKAITTKAGKGVYKVSLSGDSGVADVQGAGSYRAGDTVTVTATLLIGYTFRQWASSDPALLPNGTTQTYKFTMPAGNVSLKVITYIKPKVTLHAGVGVYSVTGGGSYAIGQSVTVSAVMEQGYEFSGWTSDSSGFGSSQLSYTFIMPEHGVTLTATGTAKTFTVSVKAGTGISGVSGSGQYKVGDIVTINATVQPNYSFSGWSGHTINYPNSVSTTFVMPGKDITIFASAKENPKYTISVARGDNGITSVSGGGSFYAGTSVTVSCQVATGYVFNGWNSSNTNLLKGSISQSYSFKMPAGNVTLTARAKSNQYSLSLSRGTGIQSVSGGGKYIAGSSVTVSCTPSKGYEFKEWISSSSKLKGSLAQSYTFSMPEANVALTAKAVKIQYMMAAQKDADIRTEGNLSLNLNRKPAAAYAQISSECIPNLWTSNDITPCVAESKKFTSPKNKCI